MAGGATRRPPAGSWRPCWPATLEGSLLAIAILALLLGPGLASAHPLGPGPAPPLRSRTPTTRDAVDLTADWSEGLGSGIPVANASAALYGGSPQFPLLFGGNSSCGLYCNETLGFFNALGTQAWYDISTLHSPPPRTNAALAWDPVLRELVLFGGLGSHGPLNDTWTYVRASGWTELHPAASPPPLSGSGFAYDPSLGEVLLFGGEGANGPVGETWVFNGTTWKELSLQPAPSPRAGADLAYDAQTGSLVLFGGEGPTGFYNDTWAFRSGGWQPLFPSRAPSPRADAAEVTTGNGRPLIFGGVGSTGALNDSFLWTNGSWVPVGYASGVSPPPLVSGSLVADPSLGNNFYTFLGGYASPGGVTDAGWTLYLPFGGAPNGTQPLTSQLTASQSRGTAPMTVTFETTVTGGEGPFLYSWTFGDGTSATGSPTEIHTYTRSGSYVVTLTVTDAVGDVSVSQYSLEVLPPTPPSPFTYLGGPTVWALLIVVGGVALWGGAGAVSSNLVTRRIRSGVGHPPSRTRESALLLGAAIRSGDWSERLPGLVHIWFPHWRARHDRRRASPTLLWLGRRVLLAFPQLLVGTTLLYILSVVVPSLLTGTGLGSGFLSGWVTFNVQLFTGQWGFVYRLENQSLVSQTSVITLLGYNLPDTLELAALSLGVATLVSYPLGLLAGWRQGKGVDHATRTLAAFGGYFPLVALVLVLTFVFYTPFLNVFGDSPFGTLPSGAWFEIHQGGFPGWIGFFGQTLPTGFPLVDAALAGAWPAEGLILAKALFQSLVIGIAYSALFLRFARLGAASQRQSFHLVASRARGVSDRRLLWHDTSRLVLPVYVYTFGNTFAIFLVIQTLAEWFFNDTGFGSFLVQGILGQAYSVNAPPLVAVLSFLFLLVILVVNITADALSRYLDPRIAEPSRGGGR